LGTGNTGQFSLDPTVKEKLTVKENLTENPEGEGHATRQSKRPDSRDAAQLIE
jgi:hypothetical protein